MYSAGWNVISYVLSDPVTYHVWKGFDEYVTATTARNPFNGHTSQSWGCSLGKGSDDAGIVDPFQGIIHSWFRH